MPAVVETPNTSAEEVVQQPQGTPEGGNEPTPPPTQEDYFLDVDERHRYKTQDDAKRAVQESGRRIGELTPWQEHAQRYGLRDPQQLPQVFDSYLQMRDRLAQLEAQVTANAKGQEPAPQTLSAQDKTNVEYLESHGFSRKEAIDKVLQERLSPLEQRVQQLSDQLGRSEELQNNAAVDAGRNYLATLMTENNIPVDNPQVNGVIEDSIIAWMEANSVDRKGNIVAGSPLDRFYAGGTSMREVVKQGYDRWFTTVNVLRQSADGQYQQRKEANVNRTPRPMPRQGAPVPTEQQQPATPARRTPGAGGIFTDPALHDKAWELMQEHQSRR